MSSTVPARPTAVRQVITAGAVAVLIAVVAGATLRFTAATWLELGTAVGLVVWIGGMVTVQVLLSRLLDTHGAIEAARFLRLSVWLVPHVLVPASFAALACGITRTIVTGGPLLSLQCVVLLILFLIPTIGGGRFTGPRYRQLLTHLDTTDTTPVRRELVLLNRINQLELVLAIGIGAPLLIPLAT